MSAIDLNLDGDGAWPDLAEKTKRGKVVHLGEGSSIGVAALTGGMQSGRASVAFRFDLPDGGTVVAEMSLRTLWAATVAIAARHGEPHMQVQPTSATIRQLQLALGEMGRQLLECQERHGEPTRIDLSAADRQWEDEQRKEKGATT